MDGEKWDEFPELDPTEFRLVNGNWVRVVFGHYWTRPAPGDFINGYMPSNFYGVRIYSNEGTFSEQQILQYELRAPHDFCVAASPPAREWINEMVRSRRMMEFDSVEEFATAFAEELNRLSETANDAVRHCKKGEIDAADDSDEPSDNSFDDTATNEQIT